MWLMSACAAAPVRVCLYARQTCVQYQSKAARIARNQLETGCWEGGTVITQHIFLCFLFPSLSPATCQSFP